jgi:CheY-like chemotaxis protein
MKRLRLSQKIAVVALAPAMTLCLLAAAVFVILDATHATRDARLEADRLAASLVPFVAGAAARSEADLTAALAAVATVPCLVEVVVEDAAGTRQRAPRSEAVPTGLEARHTWRVARTLDGTGSSRMILTFDHSHLSRRAERTLVVALGALAGAFVLSLAFFKAIESGLLRPIKHLVFTARMVSEARTFSVRARSVEDEDLRPVGECLNAILDRLREREELVSALEDELRDARRSLAALLSPPSGPPIDPGVPPANRSTSTPGLPKGLRVLLAEDNDVNATLARRLLEKQGCIVTTAANGKVAIEEWKRGHVDVILMDVIMPEMDGLEATAAIRALERDIGTRTPILALTGNTSESDKVVFLASGMDGFVAKPIHLPTLVDAVLVALSGATVTVGAPTAGPGGSEEEAAGGSRVIDRESLLLRLDGDLDLLQEMVRLFETRRLDLFNEVSTALQARDREAFVRAVHTLKGTVANLGALGAFELAKELETLGRKGDLEAALPRLPELEAELEAFREALGLVVRSEAA